MQIDFTGYSCLNISQCACKQVKVKKSKQEFACSSIKDKVSVPLLEYLFVCGLEGTAIGPELTFLQNAAVRGSCFQTAMVLLKVEHKSLLCVFYIKLGVIQNSLQRGQLQEKLQFLLESNIKEAKGQSRWDLIIPLREKCSRIKMKA